MKHAFGVGTGTPHGRAVVQHSRLLKETHQQLQSSSWLFSSHSSPFNSLSADEEIYVQNNRLVWSCGGLVRKQFTTPHSIIQATWVHFNETGSHPHLCLLQSTLLTIYALEGEVHSMPLACRFTEIWPLPRGMLLAGSLQCGPCLLTHPLESLQPVSIQSPTSRHSHENVLWTSTKVPYMVTWCPAPSQVCYDCCLPKCKTTSGFTVRLPLVLIANAALS